MKKYIGGDGERYHKRKHDVSAKVFDWIAKARADKFGSWVKCSDSVLEFGVGVGFNLAALTCKSKMGFDTAAHLKPVVEDRGIQFVDDEGSIPNTAFDVVVCHHVLEHVNDPFAKLQKIRPWLKPGGKLLLYVPYEHERRYEKYRRDDSDFHLYSWTVQTAAYLVETAGFKVHEARLGRFGFDRFAAVVAMKLRSGQMGYRFFRRVLQIVLQKREVIIVATA